MRIVANPRFRLLSLPLETVEGVLLCLPPPTILGLRVLSREIRELIDASPTIQYRVELFAASAEDDLRNTSVAVADRRALLEQYHSRWGKLRGDKWKSVPLPAHTKRILEGGVLGCIMESGDNKLDVHFFQLPSVSRRVRLEQWTVRGLPKCDATLRINPEADLLVVPEVLNGGRTFRTRILRLSDGFPRVFASANSTAHCVEYESKRTLSHLNILVSGRRLVAVAAFEGTTYFGRDNTLVVWDWRNGERILKTSSFWVDQVQFVDDYRIIAITKPNEHSMERSLAMWDTTTTKERLLIFGMPTGGIMYKPKGLVNHTFAPAGVGLHRSDPARRAVGILCRGNRGKGSKDNDYMIVINAAAIYAHAHKKNSLITKISWKAWQRSTTIIKTPRSATKTMSISGCWFFAMADGLSGWNFIELLRIYDFSTGTRSGRYPNRPLVRDVLLNLGRGVVDEGKKDWGFSEDNLLLFHTREPNGRTNLLLWTL